MSTDYYDMLGVARDADAATIKRAFRKRARELHPDVNDSPDAEEKFRAVTTAYEVLSDDERRSIYDRYGEAGLKQQHWEPQFASFGNIADIFSAFFGDELFGGAARHGRQAGTRGENVLVNVDLDFSEAALGTTREVEYDTIGACDRCGGRGATSEAGIRTCDGCGGTGAVRTVARSLFGQVIQESTCPRCGGRGDVVTDPCDTCSGTGEQVEHRTVTIEIPAGIASGQRIRLTGRGGVGSNGGPAGNLYVEVRVADDDRFLRDGDDLVTVVDVTFIEAALGCSKVVPCVDGDDEEIELPPGVQPGEVVVLSERGVGRIRGGGRGDLRIVINVIVPRVVTDEQREHLEHFRELEDAGTYADGDGIVSKLRRILRG